MVSRFPDVFISGLRTEFSEIRTTVQEIVLKYMDIKVRIFEREGVPGAEPSEEECEKWGRECDLFILIAGGDYGYTCSTGISFTELEYDAAFNDDATKIRVFKKTGVTMKDVQKTFIEKIRSGPQGKRYTEFQEDDELLTLIPRTIVAFLIGQIIKETSASPRYERSEIGNKVAYFLNTQAKHGYPREAFYKEDLCQKIGITEDELESAIEELDGLKMIHQSYGSPIISPLNKLFWETNKDLYGWNVESDAKVIAQMLLDDKESPHIYVSKLDLPWDSDNRRLNAAVTYLADKGYIDFRNISGERQFAVTKISKNDATWGYCNIP